jgi:nicotinate-nucleotide pyrophosphorylase (carboxylating)
MPIIEFDDNAKRDAETLIELALGEDLGDVGDLTGMATIPARAFGSALVVARARGVAAGLEVVAMIADRFEIGDRFEILAEDGSRVAPGTVAARVSGPMRSLLAMERTALNFLQRLSGIATLTASFVEKVAGSKAVILDTRKTTPGWRALEKYAVRCGGGRNHRFGLHDGILIKDNHLAWLDQSSDPIGEAVAASRAYAAAGMIVEVEVDSLDQLDAALSCRPDIVLLDNFDVADLIESVARRDERAPSVLLEASGGVSLDSVAAIARTDVDRISIGALTHSAPALDFGLDFERVLPS